MAQQPQPQATAVHSASFGVVKSVLSGDCVIVTGGDPNAAIPPEKTLVLSGVTAPKLCRGAKNAPDDPWAWEAREYLRKKLIGRQVSFTAVAQAGSAEREYANIVVDNENVALGLVRAGLATVKAPAGGKVAPDKQEMLDLEQQAKDHNLGQFSKEPSTEHVRVIDWSPNPTELFAKFKGQELPGVVSQFREGTNIRVEVAGSIKGGIKPGKEVMMITLNLAGAASPRWRQSQKADDPRAGETGFKEEKSAPFGAEAKHFSETRLLNRDVKIVLVAVDVSGILYGVVKFVKGNITLKLLESGLASFLAWSAFPTGELDALKAAYLSAKEKKLGVWSLEGADAPIAEIERTQYAAHVVQIVSGDTLVVERDDGENKGEVRLLLASVRAPKLAARATSTREAKESEPWAIEAKEFLRKRLIGKRVIVCKEYERPSPNRIGEQSQYCSVFLGQENVGVSLVAAGLAEAVPHQREEPRSIYYCKICDAQADAKKKQLGKYNPNPPSQPIISDLTEKAAPSADPKAPGTGNKAKAFLTFLQRDRPNTQGIVEFCFGPTKFKVFVPKENCVIALALVGVKVARDSPFEAEALDFVKSKVLQHTVRLDIETVDLGNNFIGSLVTEGTHFNVGVELLRAGYANVFSFSANKSQSQRAALEAAEEEARNARRGIWKDYDESAAVIHTGETKDEEDTSVGNSSGAASGSGGGGGGGGPKKFDVKVTEITDAVTFYYRESSDSKGSMIDGKMAEFAENLPAAGPPKDDLISGTVCAGLYTDGNWYRVKIEGRAPGDLYRVCFMDFGNHDAIPFASIRMLPPDLKSIPAQAKAAVLAGLKAPSANSDHFEGAAITLSQCALERTLQASVECVGKDNKLHIVLYDPEHPDLSINAMMARDGWCRVLERPERKLFDYCAKLRKEEAVAKLAKVNIWEYGNVSDDEAEVKPKGPGGKSEPKAKAEAKGKAGDPKAKDAGKKAAPAKPAADLNKFDGRPPKRAA